jgi:uncharacterized membrane protein
MKLLRAAGILFAGLFAGFLVAVLVLELSLRSYDGAVYTQVRHVELDNLDKLASATLIPALILTALLVFFLARAKQSVRLPATALALMVLILGLTLIVNLPINSDQLDWKVQSPPSDWATVRDHWQLAHALRTVVAVLAFGCLTFSRVRTPDAQP